MTSRVQALQLYPAEFKQSSQNYKNASNSVINTRVQRIKLYLPEFMFSRIEDRGQRTEQRGQRTEDRG